MKRKEVPAPSWLVDYSAARAHAIRWLGDRYLLARPINAGRYGSHPPAPGILMSPESADAQVPHPNHPGR